MVIFYYCTLAFLDSHMLEIIQYMAFSDCLLSLSNALWIFNWTGAMITEASDKSVFRFVRKYQTVFQSHCAAFIPPAVTEISCYSIPLSASGVHSYVICICNFLVIYDIAFIVLCLFVICVSSLLRFFFRLLAHLSIGFFVSFVEL